VAHAKRSSAAPRRRPARPRAPLAGVRILDFTRILAGPFGSMSLGDMGAEVIKIEEPGKGDDTRGWPPFVGGEATYFLAVNRNKKSLTLNMKAPEGQAILRKLVARADVVLENFRPGTMERLGFGYAALAGINPRIVYCSISGFGESGPEASRPGYDLIVQGESGVMDITGFPDGPPVKVGNSIADLVAGMAAAQGITLALLARERTGRGQKVEIGMLDVMAALLTYQAGLYWNAGGRPGRRGNQHPSIVPYEVFQARDAYLTLGVANNGLWEKMCRAIGHPELIRDPRNRNLFLLADEDMDVARISEGSRTSAPTVSARRRRMGEKSAATIGATPLSFKAAITASPTGPQPTTSGASGASMRALFTACTPTAIGSVSAACSVDSPLGTGRTSAAESRMNSP